MKSFNNNQDPQQDLFDFEEFPLPEEKMPKTEKRKKNKNTHSTLSPDRGDVRRTKGFTPPSLEHVQIYFLEKGHPKTEAERFFNYYECTGWLVGTNKKMKDWKAAARNWMLNINKYANKSSGSSHNRNADAERNQSNKLKPPGHKPSTNYSKPL
ncbi:MAG: hypothetical protein JEZ14_19765 [Marinilabiliaceae bacterium]|nr:hypothetical protein [Marinilabiliaceae bacterium]